MKVDDFKFQNKNVRIWNIKNKRKLRNEGILHLKKYKEESSKMRTSHINNGRLMLLICVGFDTFFTTIRRIIYTYKEKEKFMLLPVIGYMV